MTERMPELNVGSNSLNEGTARQTDYTPFLEFKPSVREEEFVLELLAWLNSEVSQPNLISCIPQLSTAGMTLWDDEDLQKHIAEKLKYFNEMCTEFKLGYQQSLAEKLPLIRGGREEEAKLAEILKNRHSSPFNTTSLNQWMDYKEKEIWILEAFIKMMKNTTFIASEIQLYQEALSAPTVEMVEDVSLQKDVCGRGMTLWDEDMLSKHIRVREQNFSEFEVITSDSLQSKTSSLNVDASLKLSILGGKVKVGGSGNYLNDSKSSKHQERVTLRYKETNQFKEMSMYHLGKLKYGNVIDKGLATHVVTGILYGAQAFFVFDREVSEGENHQAIHGDLKMMIKKIPKFALQVKGDVKMNTEEQKKVDQFSCTFFGDVCLDKCPTTFDEAIETYKSLPEKFKEKGNDVPMTLEFQETLAEKLPLIRGGAVEEAELTKILDKTRSSVCNNRTLNQWIDQKEREIYTLMLFKEKMKNTIFIQSETQLYKEVVSKDQVQILCFVFTSLGRDEPFLSASAAYLKGTRTDNEGAGFEEKKYLNASDIVSQEIKEKLNLFSDFAEGNKENQKIKFLAVGLTDDNHKSSTIYLYENGFLVDTNYKLPSKPETVTADDINHNNVTLKVSPPRFGAESVISYSVEVRENTADKWSQKIEPKAEKVTVRDLKPNTEYVFRCRGVTSVGYGPASDPTGPIKTLPFLRHLRPFSQSQILKSAIVFHSLTGDRRRKDFYVKTVMDSGVLELAALGRPFTLGTLYNHYNDTIVTGILYGAQVFFVFDRDVSEGENHQEVHGNMTMVVNKMSQMAGEMKGDVIIDPKVQDAEKYKCTFHGDVCPDKKPTNFQEAIEIYKSLPELLKDGEKAVPIKVFMLPLTSFGTTASKLVRQISSELKEDLEKKLSIRAKEAQLAEILKKKRSSFRNSDLKWWLDCKEKEVNTIKSITEKMKNPNIIPSLNGDHETGADEVYYFVFTSLGRDEPLLSALSAYLKGTKEDNQNQDLHDVEREQWYASKEKLRDIRKKAKAFSDFTEDNKDNQKMKFLVVGLTDDKYEGSTIYLYKNDTIVNKNYELPSKPETPITHQFYSYNLSNHQ
ncbi:hypothetical protein CCH79_00001238 [Gambusia affinis]|uniref:Fibronectin type-III domain-containing protein n=1 Tax=Gambusia affinis TaxID=33528 RepID=A0A315VSU7_GAMAF|nr:hypothetical protein CCH79_00001238 [Gambusia affinis]